MQTRISAFLDTILTLDYNWKYQKLRELNVSHVSLVIPHTDNQSDPLNDMNQYSILDRIGEGAHGIVFKAKHIEVRMKW